MTIADLIRQNTLDIRDSLTQLENLVGASENELAAAEERIKRCGTELTRQRALESERKRSLSEISDKVQKAQSALDEIERRRQEALENFINCQEELNQIDVSFRSAQTSAHKILSDIRKEQDLKQKAEAALATLRADRTEKQHAHYRAILESLDCYLGNQYELFQNAFSSEEEQKKARREFEEFKKARHTDPLISKLCEQRDELRKFLASAAVEDVRALLESALKNVEEQLIRRFPRALQSPENLPKDSKIEELLYYCNRNGKVVFLLPIDSNKWSSIALGEISSDISNSLCLIWNIIRGLNLKANEGKFIIYRDHAAFESCFDLEDVAYLQNFDLNCEGTIVMRFALASVPKELQEALIYEDENS